VVDFFCHVSGAVEAGEGPVGVDEANYEGNTVGGPAGIVDEVGENELCGFAGGC